MTDKQAEIVEGLKDHLEGRGIERDRVTPTADLFKDLGFDSLDAVELTLGIEERFGVEIPDQELEGLVTVADAVDLIERKLSVGA